MQRVAQPIEFIILKPCEVIINSDGAREINYTWDGKFFRNVRAANKEGLKSLGHDDFNVGQVEHGVLTKLFWMHKDLEETKESLEALQKQIGL